MDKSKCDNKDDEQKLMNGSYEGLFPEDFVEGSIAFSDWSDETTNGDDVGFGQVDGAIFIDVADVELDGSIVLGSDESVSVIAFSWEIKISQFVIEVHVTPHLCLNVSLSSALHC